MIKILTIAWKDVKISYRDPAALIMMLVTPFALTLAMGFAFGGLGGNASSGLSGIPVIVLNEDQGEFGQQLEALLQSEELSDLLDISMERDVSLARASVDQDLAAAVVMIPDNFSESILPSQWMADTAGKAPGDLQPQERSIVEFYTNPTRPISAGVVRGIVDRFIAQASAGAVAGRVTIGQILENGLVPDGQVTSALIETGMQSGRQAALSKPVRLLVRSSTGEGASDFNSIGFIAPSMGIIFLMFTVTAGGRSLLIERQSGTLPRLLVTPSRTSQVLSGKISGIFLTGLAQMVILMTAAWLLLGVRWNDILALALLLAALVAAASSWGIILAAFSRTPGQASNIGTALSLIFAVAGGNFLPRQQMPEWLQLAGFISPNAWGLEAFSRLSTHETLVDILPYIAGLLAMAAILFGVSTIAFRRQYR